jgi:hypothetical protein
MLNREWAFYAGAISTGLAPVVLLAVAAMSLSPN